ncbi:MAG: UDP-N-acetylmuramate dehydrogenase [Chloroflexi bacterium]|nr:UDP-N-acetylmuramate dehydrogenase [Chloroflexota bacterium]
MNVWTVPPAALAALAQRLEPGVRWRHVLAPYTTYRIGGPADLFLVATRAEEVVTALQAAHALGVPCRLIGGASNLLIADAGVAGLVIKLSMSGVRFIEDPGGPERVIVVAAAGCQLASLARQCARRGLAGLVWASNVPGSVGAAVVNNAGAFGGCMADVLVRALVVDPQGQARYYTPAELAMEYRSTRLKAGALQGAVLEAELALTRADPRELEQQLAQVRERRRQSQPSGFSAGSMFTNPPGDAAGRLIEAAGLKGYRCGDAQISPQHANFFLNLGAATAREVYALMRVAQDAVYRQTGIWLRPEVQLVGRWTPAELAALAAPGGAP